MKHRLHTLVKLSKIAGLIALGSLLGACVETAVARVAALALKRYIESGKTQITVTTGLDYGYEALFYKPRNITGFIPAYPP